MVNIYRYLTRHLSFPELARSSSKSKANNTAYLESVLDENNSLHLWLMGNLTSVNTKVQTTPQNRAESHQLYKSF